jgi:hypothetical protein
LSSEFNLRPKLHDTSRRNPEELRGRERVAVHELVKPQPETAPGRETGRHDRQSTDEERRVRHVDLRGHRYGFEQQRVRNVRLLHESVAEVDRVELPVDPRRLHSRGSIDARDLLVLDMQ